MTPPRLGLRRRLLVACALELPALAYSRPIIVLAATVLGCASEAPPSGPEQNPGALRYNACPAGGRAGSFTVDRDHGATFVTGQVFDAVLPAPEELRAEGDCRLLKVSAYSCDPPCGAGTACGPGAKCLPAPNPRSVGSVTIKGIGRPRVIAPNGSAYYASPGNPPYQDGVDVGLVTGGGAYPPFTIWARGVSSIETTATALRSELDQPLPVAWTPPSPADDRVRVTIAVELAVHRDAVSIECDVADTGSFEVPAALMTELRRVAVGLPGQLLESDVLLHRRSVDSVMIAPGCVELVVRTPATVPLELGCTADGDCFPGQRCGADRACK